MTHVSARSCQIRRPSGFWRRRCWARWGRRTPRTIPRGKSSPNTSICRNIKSHKIVSCRLVVSFSAWHPDCSCYPPTYYGILRDGLSVFYMLHAVFVSGSRGKRTGGKQQRHHSQGAGAPSRDRLWQPRGRRSTRHRGQSDLVGGRESGRVVVRGSEAHWGGDYSQQ